MKKLLILFYIFFSSQSFAQQQFFINIAQYEVRFANWVRSGNQIVGNYYYTYVANEDLKSYQQTFKLTGRITGKDISITYDGTLKNGRFNGKDLNLYISDNGRIVTRVFKPSSISEHNKQIDRITSISAKLQLQAEEAERREEANAQALDRAQTLDNQIQELYQSSLEITQSLTEYKTALAEFVHDPTKVHHQDFSIAAELHSITFVLRDTRQAFDSIDFNVKRKDCDYLNDINNAFQRIVAARDKVLETPNLQPFYESLINPLRDKARTRLGLAQSELTRLNTAISRDKIKFNPAISVSQLQAAQKEFETVSNSLKIMLSTFDADVRTSAGQIIDAYSVKAQEVMKMLDCPAK